MNTNIVVIDDFISPTLISELLEVPVPALEYGRHDWRCPNGLVDNVVWRASDILRGAYGIDQDIYCDYVALTASSEGMSHVLHADAETLEGQPNHTPWRLVTAMIYLNTQSEDFHGGSIEFPRISQTVMPKAGRFVGFRCDGIHSHAVNAVTKGVRRALAMWFTTDDIYRDRWAPKPE